MERPATHRFLGREAVRVHPCTQTPMYAYILDKLHICFRNIELSSGQFVSDIPLGVK